MRFATVAAVLTVLVAVPTSRSIVAAADSADDSLPSATHYSLAYEIFPSEGRLEGRATIRVENRTEETWKEIPFLLYRLLQVERVTARSGAPLDFETDIVRDADSPDLQVNRVDIWLSEPLEPGQSTELLLQFAGPIHGYREVWGYVRDTISEAYTLLRDDTFAYPILSLPTAASRYQERRFTYDLKVSVPAGYTVAAGGHQTGVDQEGDHAVFSYVSKVPVWRLDVAAAKFSVHRSDDGALAVYVLPGHEEGAARVLEAMRASVDLYSDLFGSVGDFLGYTAIEIPPGWGSQAADLYFLQTAAAFEDPDRVVEVYHEVAHNWNAKPRADVQRCRYFDEAFASYFQALAERAFRGEVAWLAEMEHSRTVFVRWVARDPAHRETPIVEYGTKDMGHLSYSKGAWSLYVLHQLVGDVAFQQIVRDLLATSDQRAVGFDDFERIAQSAAGRDLGRYIEDWLRGSESSRLLLDGISIEEILARYK